MKKWGKKGGGGSKWEEGGGALGAKPLVGGESGPHSYVGFRTTNTGVNNGVLSAVADKWSTMGNPDAHKRRGKIGHGGNKIRLKQQVYLSCGTGKSGSFFPKTSKRRYRGGGGGA